MLWCKALPMLTIRPFPSAHWNRGYTGILRGQVQILQASKDLFYIPEVSLYC